MNEEIAFANIESALRAQFNFANYNTLATCDASISWLKSRFALLEGENAEMKKLLQPNTENQKQNQIK